MSFRVSLLHAVLMAAVATAGALIASPRTAAAAQPGDNEAILYELPDYQTQSGKFRIVLKMPAGKVYQAFEIGDMHPRLGQMGPGRALIRSIELGKNMGALLRYGQRAYMLDGPSANNSVILDSQPRLEKPFINNHPLNVLLFRKDVVPRPQGVSFQNLNPYTTLSGPLGDDLHSTFHLANSDSPRERPLLGMQDNVGWVTLHGKGTKLRVWVNGNLRELTAKNDDPRDNTFRLADEGMALHRVDRYQEGNRIRSRVEITAPEHPVPAGPMGQAIVINPSDLGNLLKPKAPPTPPQQPSPKPGIGPPVQGETPSIVGVYRQVGIVPADIIIGQSNANRSEFACRIPQMKLFGKGTIGKDGKVIASFGAPNANNTDFGPLGAFNTVEGEITKVDAKNNVVRIEWANGVVYERK